MATNKPTPRGPIKSAAKQTQPAPAAKTTSTQVATRQSAPPPARAADTALPAFMRGKAGRGTEAIKREDIEIPRIKLIQAISEKELSTYDFLKPGMFFHTLGEQSLGERVRIVPLYTDTRYLLWNPRDQGGGILARADDGVHWVPANKTFDVKINKGRKTVQWTTADTVAESGLDQWGTYDPDDEQSQPAATQMFTIVAELLDYPELSPCIITLQRGSIRVGRNLMGKLKISRAPSYGMIFIMQSVDDTGAGGNFKNYQFIGDGLVEDEEQFKEFEAKYEGFARMGVKIKDLEGANDEGETGAPRASGETAADRPNY